MARLTTWIAFCLSLALLVGCAGVRPGGACATACAPPPCASPCDPNAAPTPPPEGDRPPEAKAGEAWCRVWVPPVTQEIERRVCVRPASQRTVKIPAEYGTRPKLVCVAPAQLSEVVKPPVWTQKHEDVLVRPSRDVFRRVKCANDPCGECWVKETCPPEFEEQCKAVCVEPSRKCVEFRPAQYKLLEERFEIHPASTRRECVPAEFEIRTETVCVSPGHWEWRRNDACEVPVETLPALEVEMIDTDEQGHPKGIFEVGEIVRYDLIVRSDVGSEAFPTIRVFFSLPESLEFVSGEGQGITITGAGQEASSTVFKLSLEQEVRMHVLARVVSVPPTEFVQATASVRTEAGDELARETESTTLAANGKR